MHSKLRLVLCIILPTAFLVYGQGNETKTDPSPLTKPLSSKSQELPELKNQAYVGTQQFEPQRDEEWVEQCLNLSLDQKKWGCKIIVYRIQWFSGQWSSWFVPGVNDLYKKSDEPLRRFWACFNDHSFEIIYTADQKIDFKKIKNMKVNPEAK